MTENLYFYKNSPKGSFYHNYATTANCYDKDSIEYVKNYFKKKLNDFSNKTLTDNELKNFIKNNKENYTIFVLAFTIWNSFSRLDIKNIYIQEVKEEYLPLYFYFINMYKEKFITKYDATELKNTGTRTLFWNNFFNLNNLKDNELTIELFNMLFEYDTSNNAKFKYKSKNLINFYQQYYKYCSKNDLEKLHDLIHSIEFYEKYDKNNHINFNNNKNTINTIESVQTQSFELQSQNVNLANQKFFKLFKSSENDISTNHNFMPRYVQYAKNIENYMQEKANKKYSNLPNISNRRGFWAAKYFNIIEKYSQQVLISVKEHFGEDWDISMKRIS